MEAYSILKNGNEKLSEHFKVREFYCHDGSDPVFIDTALVEVAADIQVQGISVEQVYAYADKLLGNAGGCGIYPPGLGRANGWVHVDVRKAKSRWKG